MSDPIETWAHPACLSDEELLSQCHLGRGRSGGPGGQHRNKVETEVTITHDESGVSAKAGERRSQQENKRVALKRLRLALATRYRCGAPAGEIGSKLWWSRVRKMKISLSVKHADYPKMLAEALDVIDASGWDLKDPALRLGVTQSQLLKLIKDHPEAWETLNNERKRVGLRPLR